MLALSAAALGVSLVGAITATGQPTVPVVPSASTTPAAVTPQGSQVAAPVGTVPPPFKIFRYDEDYSSLADPARRTGTLDALKYIPLSSDGSVTLSLGGEARTRYEYLSAPFFGLRQPGQDDFVIQRLLLHADLHMGDRTDFHARAFVQVLSGLVAGEEFAKPGNQDNALDIQQGFGELVWGDNRAPALAKGGTAFAIRGGRQEMGFGSYRLVTIRDGTNARLAFDGVRATLNADRMTFDAFLVRPVDPKIGLFNDGEDDNTTFWGVYSTLPLAPEKKLAVDFYYLGLSRDNTRFQSGVGDETRHSLGTRLSGRANGWDHDTEAVLQVGTFDRAARSEDILAWTVASNTGFTFENVAWRPRIGLKLNVASGDDDPADGRLGTFNPLFPRNNYFSDANLLAPYNFFNIHPTIAVRPTDSVTITAGWDAYFRYSTDDAVFAPTGIVIPATASDDRYVGSTVSVVAEWAINRHLSLAGSYSHFLKGDVVRDARGKDVDFFGLWITAKF